MRRSLLIGSVTAATLAGGIAAAQAPFQQAARVPITSATVAPRPVRLAPAARDVAVPTAADAQGGPYAAMDEPLPATAAYPASAPAAAARPVHASQRVPAAAVELSGAQEGVASAPRETAAQRRAAAQAATNNAGAETMNGRMGRLLHDSMASLFEASPLMARSTGIQMQKLANGVSISYVSDDPAVVERLQKMADAVRLLREASAE
ncbi:MAG TPA: hypothetical protein VHC69_22390 [Polyangiaceae bacterium]|nr:hypothetical protein [Polyangiaceae bacterium]